VLRSIAGREVFLAREEGPIVKKMRTTEKTISYERKEVKKK
jgi:hypothetical protein